MEKPLAAEKLEEVLAMARGGACGSGRKRGGARGVGERWRRCSAEGEGERGGYARLRWDAPLG